MINFGYSLIKDRLIIIDPEIRMKLWLELSAKHPHIVKVRTQSVEIPYNDIWVPHNYKPTVNQKTGKKYPDCCSFHQAAFKELKEWTKVFPYCCNEHMKLGEAPWFVKRRYSTAGKKVVKQLICTQYHILQNINSTSWYEDITDYIIANERSFGQLPHGFGCPVGLEHYFRLLKSALSENSCLDTNKLNKEKILRLKNFIDCSHHNPEIQNKIFLEHYSIQKKWLELFPFNLIYFIGKDEFYKGLLPSLGVRYNIFLGENVFVRLTEKGLVEVLIEHTKYLLKSVNSKELLEKGHIRDIDKHQLDLINEKHRIRQTALIENYSKEEIEYVSILENWLENERKYFDEVKPLMNVQPKDIEKEPFYDNSLWERTRISSDWVPYDKTVFGCLKGRDKSQDGAAKNLSKKQLAMCYHYLKKDENVKWGKLIDDQIDNGSAYRKSFQAYSQWLDPKSKNAPKAHETMYNYVNELMKKKNFTPSEIRDLHVVMDAIGYFPSVKKLIDDDLNGLE